MPNTHRDDVGVRLLLTPTYESPVIARDPKGPVVIQGWARSRLRKRSHARARLV